MLFGGVVRLATDGQDRVQVWRDVTTAVEQMHAFIAEQTRRLQGQNAPELPVDLPAGAAQPGPHSLFLSDPVHPIAPEPAALTPGGGGSGPLSVPQGAAFPQGVLASLSRTILSRTSQQDALNGYRCMREAFFLIGAFDVDPVPGVPPKVDSWGMERMAAVMEWSTSDMHPTRCWKALLSKPTVKPKAPPAPRPPQKCEMVRSCLVCPKQCKDKCGDPPLAVCFVKAIHQHVRFLLG